MSKKVITQDFLITEEQPVPTPDIQLLQGKAFKQTGKIVTIVAAYDYFIERIKESETEMYVFNMHNQAEEKMAAALFELWIKNLDNDQPTGWICYGMDYLPTDMRMYADDSPYIIF